MEAHAGASAGVAEEGCRAVTNLCSGSNERRMALVAAGAPRCVEEAMAAHAADGGSMAEHGRLATAMLAWLAASPPASGSAGVRGVATDARVSSRERPRRRRKA
mmetsp:Transcript_31111/g.98746  ORF Transcript_31111/g.98746 Transcript_31111/m.98746 type:complete len:104 (-) Transcript_31111:135-446(-)